MATVSYEPREEYDGRERSSNPVASAMAHALDSLLCARDMAEAAGEPVASIYIEGAAEALRTAREHLQPRAIDALPLDPGVLSLQGTTIGLRRRHGSMLADRGWLEERDGRFAFVVDPLADEEGWSSTPDIGAALLLDEEAISMCVRPWSASLLADALASNEWLHLASGEPCSLTRSASAALVRAAGGGRKFPDLARGETQGLVDARIADLLKRLGWRRTKGPLVH
jgi:hypothetical protein